jgi:hypothetical protein
MTSESCEETKLPSVRTKGEGKKAKGELETYCSLVHVTTKQILGQDAETKAFVEKAGIVLDFNVDAKLWAKRVTSTMYLMHPLHLIQRKGGYEYLGTSRAFHLAHSSFSIEERFPAILLSKRKLSKKEKLSFLSADLMYLVSSFRTRHGLGKTVFDLTQKLKIEGVHIFSLEDAKTFKKATGFSTNKSSKKSHGDIASASPLALNSQGEQGTSHE